MAVCLTAAMWVVLPLAPAQAAPTNVLTVEVVSARTEPRAFAGAGVTVGDPIDAFRFIINEDHTGGTGQHTATGVCSPSYVPATGDPSYPESCPWTSVNADPDAAPIVAQGDEATLADGLELPDGKYLISVLADGYKLGRRPLLPADVRRRPLTVEVQPMPLPDATVKGQVFEDMAPTNGAYDNGDVAARGLRWGTSTTLLGEVTHRRLRQPAVHDLRR